MKLLRKKHSGFTLIELMIVIAIIGILAAIAIPNFIRARGRSQLTACQSNLRNLGNALEMYNVEFKGRYPTQFSSLTPNYIKTVPTCPAAGTDTYAPSYVVTTSPDSFEVFCSGNNHGGFSPPNYPKFNAVRGLITR